MKSKTTLFYIATGFGIIVTILMLSVFGLMLVGSVIDKGIGEIKEIAYACFHWYDDPTGFFFAYMIGYAIVWWRPLPGSLIIIAGSMLAIIINIDNSGFLIFTLPTILVGVLYLFYWYDMKMRVKEN
jgi:hypothetical protein